MTTDVTDEVLHLEDNDCAHFAFFAFRALGACACAASAERVCSLPYALQGSLLRKTLAAS